MKKLIFVLFLIVLILSISCNPKTNLLDGVLCREMITVPGGTFVHTDGTQSFNHTISSFQIGEYEVTYELWYTVYQWAIANGYQFANLGREGNDGINGEAPTHAKYEPVSYINWRDMIVWCNAYSEIMDYTPCYTYNDLVIKDSQDSNATACDNAICDWTANGYRLPTEGEWQYAASYKDGIDWTRYDYASGAIAYHNNAVATGDVAWYSGNSENTSHTVGKRNPNSLTIYDMSGNIWEWCWDWYDFYPTTSQTDYRGALTGLMRISRGGSWSRDSKFLSVGYRDACYSYYKDDHIGFRVARYDD